MRGPDERLGGAGHSGVGAVGARRSRRVVQAGIERILIHRAAAGAGIAGLLLAIGRLLGLIGGGGRLAAVEVGRRIVDRLAAIGLLPLRRNGGRVGTGIRRHCNRAAGRGLRIALLRRLGIGLLGIGLTRRGKLRALHLIAAHRSLLARIGVRIAGRRLAIATDRRGRERAGSIVLLPAGQAVVRATVRPLGEGRSGKNARADGGEEGVAKGHA